ncbi:hypothetical protein GCM10025787_47240 [Saccharopolyspora rosea]|uniref:LuxR C-terminal-related transcriptional regulator n=1 Tax=Saccharopolyspora rosea TaxID=524884 RepID=A0ABW3FYK5_9PSEU
MTGTDVGVRLAAAVRTRESATADGTTTVLAELAAVVPYDCAALLRWDPAAGLHRPVANVGYTAPAIEFMSRCMHRDPLFPRARRAVRPLRVRDIPHASRNTPSFREVIGPLGFADGMTTCLFIGRHYVGMLNLSSTDARHPDDTGRDLVALLAGSLAELIIPRWPDGLADDGDSVVNLTDGTVSATATAVPDLADPTSPLLAELRQLGAAGPVPASLLLLHGRTLVRCRLVREGGAVLAACRPVDRPHGLSLREIEVLAALASGTTNREIAAQLGVSHRTVATHVEHILAKLDLTNRTAAAATAARWGLHQTGTAPATTEADP